MDSSSIDSDLSRMNIRGARASSVIVHHIPADRKERFLELERGVSAAVRAFPGYQGTEIYPPADDGEQEWVAVVHFDDTATLKGWLDSPVRAEWVGKLNREFGDFQLRTLPSGFGGWFTGLMTEGIPPAWKMVSAVILGLYPTVMLLTIIIGPYTAPLGLALSILISNIVGSIILQWAAMPLVTWTFAPWLKAPANKWTPLNVGGMLLIAILLACMALLFRLVAN